MPQSSKTRWWQRARDLLYTENEAWTDVVGVIVLGVWSVTIWVALSVFWI